MKFLGFVAGEVLKGKSDDVSAEALPEDAQLIEVREPMENESGAIPGAMNIRLGDLRSRLGELDKSKRYVTYCAVGLRGYLAERILKQNGFKVYNLSGGWATWRLFHPEREGVKRSGEGQQRKEDSSAFDDMLKVMKG